MSIGDIEAPLTMGQVIVAGGGLSLDSRPTRDVGVPMLVLGGESEVVVLSSVDGDDLGELESVLADGAGQEFLVGVQPGVDAGPAVEVATGGDH